MKTNLEELNYRFRKELLNNYGYRCYFTLLHSVESGELNKFNYNSWVKSLFKENGKETTEVIEEIEVCYDENLDIKSEYWGMEYYRNGNLIDILNLSEVVSSWVSLYFQHSLSLSCDWVWRIGMGIINSHTPNKFFNYCDREGIKEPLSKKEQVKWAKSIVDENS